MLSTMMKRLLSDKTETVISVALLFFILFFSYRIVSNAIVGSDYPNEYREAVNVEFTKAVLEGINPYSLDTCMQEGIQSNGMCTYPCYLYPPVYCYLCGAVSRLFPIKIIAAHYLVSIISIFLSAFLLAKLVYDRTHSVTAYLFTFAAMLFCHWRFGYVAATPDSFGLLLTVLIIVLTLKALENNKYIYVLSVLTVILFFTKQYFITVVISVLIVLFFKNKKNALKYFIVCAVLTPLTMIIYSAYCPLYWTYSVYLLKGFETYFNIKQFLYVFEQFFYMATIFGMLFLILILFVIFRKQIKPCEEKSDISYILKVQVVVQAVCLLYFGLNDGSYLTYYLQMWIPYVIASGAIDLYFIADRVKDNKKYAKALIYVIVIAPTLVMGMKRLPFVRLDSASVSEWQRAYEIVDSYHRVSGDIYYAPTLAFHGIELSERPYDTGHINITRDDYYPYWEQDEKAHKLYPYCEDIFARHMEYRERMRQKAVNHEYRLITYVDDSDYTFNDDFLEANGYELIDTIVLQTGNMQYATKFFAYNE